VKRIVVVLALAAVLAGLVGGSLASAAPSPQQSEPPQQTPPGSPHETITTVFPFNGPAVNCATGEVITLTGETVLTEQITYPPRGASTSGRIYVYHISGSGTAVDSQGNEYRYREQIMVVEVDPSDPDYPYATTTVAGHWGWDSPGQGEQDFRTYFTLHLSPNGVSKVTDHTYPECASTASPTATASATAGTQ
jgi:hypothetical protein